jgi:hypothetical protein
MRRSNTLALPADILLSRYFTGEPTPGKRWTVQLEAIHCWPTRDIAALSCPPGVRRAVARCYERLARQSGSVGVYKSDLGL